jgi:hypothetical protein
MDYSRFSWDETSAGQLPAVLAGHWSGVVGRLKLGFGTMHAQVVGAQFGAL